MSKYTPDFSLRTAGQLGHQHPLGAEQVAATWLRLLCVLLLGYALFGRGFAYVSAGPVFVGEVVLAMGMATFLLLPLRHILKNIGVMVPLLGYMGWGLACTLPFINQYGMDAARDAVLWGYGAWALVVFAILISNPNLLGQLVKAYRTFAVIFLVAAPVLSLIRQSTVLPELYFPGSGHPLVDPKAGDTSVHMAGIAAFLIAGLRTGLSRWWALAFLAVTVVANRAGLVAFAATLLVAGAFRPRSIWLGRIIVAGAVAGSLLLAAAIEVELPGGRVLSAADLTERVLSIGGWSEKSRYVNTAEWRLEWWGDIVTYTLFGEYFWQGKGYGINLATADGFQVTADDALRSPHNSHMTILARSGVPGIAAWCVLNGVWLRVIGGAIAKSRRNRHQAWMGLFIFIAAYWTAFMVNAAFDVVLEGPMAGIWFWTIYGFGMAAAWIYRHHPEVLPDDEDSGRAQSLSATRR